MVHLGRALQGRSLFQLSIIQKMVKTKEVTPPTEGHQAAGRPVPSGLIAPM